MSHQPTNSVFPILSSPTSYEDRGITLRDWFASFALHALLIKIGTISNFAAMTKREDMLEITETVYEYADSMIDSRSK